MKVFFNDQRPGYEEIVSYGPMWWTEYLEMDAVYKFAGWTLDLMAWFLEKIVGNQFPGTADEEGLAIFENILGIQPEAGSSLEERRKIVLLYYSGTGKLSGSVIQNLIRSYMGCDSDILWDGQIFEIKILGEDGPQQLNEGFLEVIRRRMPAHIAYGISLKEQIMQPEYVALAHTLAPHLTIHMDKINYYRLTEYMGIAHAMMPRISLR